MSPSESRPRIGPLFTFAVLFAWGALSGSGPIGRVSQEDEKGSPYAELVVVTYNINHGEGVDGRYSIERVAWTLAQYEPDIVALQEVDKSSRRTREDLQAEILARRLKMRYVFGENVDHMGGNFGNAILSRYPIVSSNNADISPEGSPDRRSLLRATIDVHGVMLDIYTDHPGITDGEQAYQVRRLIHILDGLNRERPMLLMGDMGLEPSSPLLQPLFQRFSHPGGKCGPDFATYPTPLKTRRHDYIFSNRGVTNVDCSVPDDSLAQIASDHLPVVATVRIELF